MQTSGKISISKLLDLRPAATVEDTTEAKFAAYVRGRFEAISKVFNTKNSLNVVADSKKQRNSMIANRYKISITRHMTFRDSYVPVINLTDEVLTRISFKAFAEAHVVIDQRDKKSVRPSVVTIRGERVNFKNSSVDKLTKLIRRNYHKTGTAACTCQYCGLEAKYVYFVRSIFKAKVNSSAFNARIVGISKNGEEQEFNIDHVVAQVSSGDNTLDNMQITCARCNRIKSALPHEVFQRDAEIIRRILRETA